MQSIIQAAGITILAFLLSQLIVQPLSFSAMSVFSAPEKTDFSITDLYAQVADRRPVRTLDPDIVIIDIAHADRDEIADILNTVSLCAPAAVGLDIMFSEPGDDDSKLLDALRANPGIVLPISLEQTAKGVFRQAEKPFFADSDIEATYAAANLPGLFNGATIREFATLFHLADGTDADSFPVSIAKAARPAALGKLRERGNLLETIDYPSREYKVIMADQLISRGEELSDKIVLIGAMNDSADMHSTPVSSYMSGIAIHAAAISTIIGGRYYDPLTSIPDCLPACVLCFLIILARYFIRPALRGIVTRILQLVIVYLAVRTGYSLYIDHHIISNASYTLLMVMFGLFAADIWCGTAYLGTAAAGRCKSYIRKIKLLWNT